MLIEILWNAIDSLDLNKDYPKNGHISCFFQTNSTSFPFPLNIRQKGEVTSTSPFPKMHDAYIQAYLFIACLFSQFIETLQHFYKQDSLKMTLTYRNSNQTHKAIITEYLPSFYQFFTRNVFTRSFFMSKWILALEFLTLYDVKYIWTFILPNS